MLVGAVGGALTLDQFPALLRSLIVVVLAVTSGVRILVRAAYTLWREPVARQPPKGPLAQTTSEEDLESATSSEATSVSRVRVAWAALGVVVGLMSVLTSTGGPFILLPLLLTFNFGRAWPARSQLPFLPPETISARPSRLNAVESIALAQPCMLAITCGATPLLAWHGAWRGSVQRRPDDGKTNSTDILTKHVSWGEIESAMRAVGFRFV